MQILLVIIDVLRSDVSLRLSVLGWGVALIIIVKVSLKQITFLQQLSMVAISWSTILMAINSQCFVFEIAVITASNIDNTSRVLYFEIQCAYQLFLQYPVFFKLNFEENFKMHPRL